MTKPIGYYVDTNIPVIAEIEERYGSNLEGMGEQQKFRMIDDLSAYILYQFHYCGVSPEVVLLCTRIRNELKQEKDAIALLKAMVNSL